MFEDSTFESTGKIRTRSRRWMMATFTFNGSILLALILIPLIHPDALPRQLMSVLIEAPRLPAAVSEPPKRTAQTTMSQSEIRDGRIVMPTQIPPKIRIVADPGPPSDASPISDLGQNGDGLDSSLFQGQRLPKVVHQPSGPMRVTSTIAEGMLIEKILPVYPPIAKVTRKEGPVVLQATIATTGAIINLRVLSGDPMLQQAALDAVRQWRYRPYLLNGQPIEVETTINVIFKLTQ